MKTKNMMGNYYVYIRMAVINLQWQYQVLARMSNNWNSHTVLVEIKMAEPFQKMVGQFLKHCIAIPLMFTLENWKMCGHTETCACKFMVVLFVITQIESTQMSLSQWMDKQSLMAIYTIQFCSAMKGNKLLIHAPIQVDPKSIVLRERNNLKRCCTIWFNLHDILRKRKL